jgi:hypothetical protein
MMRPLSGLRAAIGARVHSRGGAGIGAGVRSCPRILQKTRGSSGGEEVPSASLGLASRLGRALGRVDWIGARSPANTRIGVRVPARISGPASFCSWFSLMVDAQPAKASVPPATSNSRSLWLQGTWLRVFLSRVSAFTANPLNVKNSSPSVRPHTGRGVRRLRARIASR